MTIAKEVLRRAPRSGASSDISQRRQLEQAARTHAREVRALAARLLTAQEDERRRVARDLNDQICQQPAALAIDVSAYTASPVPPPKERERYLKSLQTRIVKASEEARLIAYQLHPSMLDDLALAASLHELCRQFSGRNPETVLEFTDNALGAIVPLEVASCVYRVAQESLNSIASHAGAKHVSVLLSLFGRNVEAHHDRRWRRLRSRGSERARQARIDRHGGSHAPGKRGLVDSLAAGSWHANCS